MRPESSLLDNIGNRMENFGNQRKPIQNEKAFFMGEPLTSFHINRGLCMPIGDCLLKTYATCREPEKKHLSLRDLGIKLFEAFKLDETPLAKNVAQPMWYVVSLRPNYLTIFLHEDLIDDFCESIKTSPNRAAVRLAEVLLSEEFFDEHVEENT